MQLSWALFLSSTISESAMQKWLPSISKAGISYRKTTASENIQALRRHSPEEADQNPIHILSQTPGPTLRSERGRKWGNGSGIATLDSQVEPRARHRALSVIQKHNTVSNTSLQLLRRLPSPESPRPPGLRGLLAYSIDGIYIFRFHSLFRKKLVLGFH